MHYAPTGSSAAAWAARGQIDEWTRRYLLAEGRNRALADGLRLLPRYYIGVLDLPIGLLARCCGPEEGMPFRVDAEGFRRKVDALEEAVRSGADLPPLIVQYTARGLVLSDGNHRFEALSRLGARTAPAVVWITEEEEYRAFCAAFGDLPAGARVVRR